MHGLIHAILKQLVLDEFGEGTWRSVLAEAEISNEAAFLEFQAQSDATTVAAFAAVAKVLGVSVEGVLRAYGDYFAHSIIAGGHVRLLESMGDDIEEFMRNMNHLHGTLSRDMRTSNFPCFEVAYVDGSRSSFRLSYHSVRGPLLAPLLEGVLPVVAERLFATRLTMTAVAPERGCCATWLMSTSPLPAPAPSAPEPVAGGGLQPLLARWHDALIGCSSAPLCRNGPLCRDGVESAAVKPEVVTASTQDIWDDAEEDAKSTSSFASVEGLGSEPILAGRLSSTSLLCMVGSASIDPELEKCFDELARMAATHTNPAELLMRSVPAKKVVAKWSNLSLLQKASRFWGTNEGEDRHFRMSEATQRANCFVSHCWSQPGDWHDVMGTKARFGEVKATQLYCAAVDVAEYSGRNWEDITLWIDKCCIPQGHPLMMQCVMLLEDFIQRCDSMIVLATWHYFTRLWCVYEWAAFLVHCNPRHVLISIEAFMRPASRSLFLEAIAGISVKRCECHIEDDRRHLVAKVNEYYVSEAAFEGFAQSTAIALVFKALVPIVSRGEELAEAELRPWAELAERLGMRTLAAALRRARPVQWRHEALQRAGSKGPSGQTLGCEDGGWRVHLSRLVDAWFEESVLPVLDEVKRKSLRFEAFVDHREGQLQRQRRVPKPSTWFPSLVSALRSPRSPRSPRRSPSPTRSAK